MRVEDLIKVPNIKLDDDKLTTIAKGVSDGYDIDKESLSAW
jgi:hypothetical protein